MSNFLNESLPAEQNLFVSILHDLPSWLIALPGALQSHDRRRGLGRGMMRFIKYRICMFSGDELMELGFKQYFNPISLSRAKILSLFIVFGCVCITGLNLLLQNASLFDVVIRLGYDSSFSFKIFNDAGTCRSLRWQRTG